ncbi:MULTISPECIES: bifunctional alpha,alpha-trehalose-phosphate synthase (UDP-forming)/trehalose-phosphatase [Sphingobacterium]|uniref:bifunctional alpha,alpha-trehalose-phosphate synthase (UDP-forming)/trehalose-phosphatase n=1 Tax=Sphingobacterium TaxID=28453 RepID=UPI0009DF6065|nr:MULTISPECIES: bifunctional alpha,alpha-trehalose-phosphate synthase (UDP-forming)/trehalose-phosphatase [Sphingobacterium]MDH5826784.1 bifunctional alpha,alpha-trehalose-phosphate synthase (UDP-forming)/trehalose-phosphatase [Sphingobacterium faecium]
MYKKRTIIVSNRLPIRIERQDNELVFISSEGGLATGLGSVYKSDENIWIGWPGIIPLDTAEEEIITTRLAEFNLIPVFLTEEELKGYYEGFSNEVLWPVFHYRPSYAVYRTTDWETYISVNEKFCSVIARQNVQEKDEVWIHDYQLMLLPQMVRKSYPSIAIGYFQHIPFPNDEVFRSIPWRNELLNGLLGADLIGFHTFNDTQHFLNSCSHILGLNVYNNCLHAGGRSIFTEVYPMGIDYDKFAQLANSKPIQARAQEIKDYYKDQKIILSIDRLDYSKGILERLLAYENLLLTYPELKEQVLLYMIVVPSRDHVAQYKQLLDEIDRTVGHINAIYGSNEWTPIAYFYNSYPLEELSALYVAADICLITSLRDGMNLVCKEYIASKENSNGVLILSELAGAAKELTQAIQINPNATDQVTAAIYQALHMPVTEQRRRLQDSIDIVKKFNVRHWVRLFFNRLREIKVFQQNEMARRINTQTKESILDQYNRAKRRLFFLDYDGTLIGFQNDAAAAIPTRSLYDTLNMLQEDDASQVVIISGRPHETLDSWFANERYFLVAEHGAWSNYPTHKWQSGAILSTRWKIPVKHIMSKFANNTAGCVIEEKSYSLAWHYRKAQPGLGQLRALELVESLRYLVQQHGLQLLMGDKVIEVKNSELNKGKAAMDIVNSYKPDFIFAIGDDATDEDMFLELPSTAITIKVGNKKSAAQFYVDSQQEAIQLIEYFAYNKNSQQQNDTVKHETKINTHDETKEA